MGRRTKTALTMAGLCLIVVFGAVFGWQQLFAKFPDSTPAVAEPSPMCTTQNVTAGQRLRSSDVQVSVFNAGTRSGLADQTLAKLERRGFVRGDVGNAPDGAAVVRVTVFTTEPNDPEAKLVALQFGRRTPVRVTDDPMGPGVDVVVGNKYRGLVKAKRSLKVQSSTSVCVPTDGASTGAAS